MYIKQINMYIVGGITYFNTSVNTLTVSIKVTYKNDLAKRTILLVM